MDKDFKIIYDILKILKDSMDYEQVDLERFKPENFDTNKNRFDRIIEMLVVDSYIDGVHITKYVDSKIKINLADIKITLKGLEYLQENSIMKRISKAVTGTVSVIGNIT